MSYQRVIPRDLFNESSLLKCYGRLYIALEGDGRAGFAVEFADSFDIVQREDDGFLFVDNLPFRVGEYEYRLVRPLNSRHAWPLYAERIDDSDFDAIPVFDGSGNLSSDMIALLGPGR
jgi:hypothetical protein